jgi:hypothetical protein
MKPSSASCTKYLRPLVLVLLFLALPCIAPGQEKKPKSSSSSSSLNSPSKSTPAPAPKPANPTPPKPAEPDEHHDEHHGGTGASGGHSSGTGASGLNSSNLSGASGHSNTAANKTNPGAPGTNKSIAGKSEPEPVHPSHDPIPADPRAPTGLNLRTAGSGSTGTYKAAGTGTTHTNPSTATAHTNSSTGTPGGKTGTGGASNSGNAGNAPGTTKLANGGTKTMHADGTSVERNRNGKVTGVTTSKGATAKMGLQGHATAIHDGKGTTISRGPHGERRIETTGADHSRLVSTGKHSGFVEKHISRGGHEFVQRSYYVNGQAYVRVYQPYFYMGYPYFGYVPGFYYMPAFYGWAYNAWPSPVPYAWGWYGAPWYTPYGYYFTPYAVYSAPTFWLADYALAESLRLAAEEAESGSLREPGFVYASAHLSPQSQANGSQLLTPAVKDMIAEQVKQIIADEKDTAARQANSSAGALATPPVPPSLDSRFTLFIVSSAISLDTMSAACPLTSGDIIQRKEYSPDGNSTVAIEVVSSKTGDCAIGTASRLKVDDLEEMHDSLREKIDAGLKSLSENQGKGGIPTGPVANPQKVSEGQADPDPTVADELKKQQEAADATEKDVQDATKDDGSAD